MDRKAFSLGMVQFSSVRSQQVVGFISRTMVGSLNARFNFIGQ